MHRSSSRAARIRVSTAVCLIAIAAPSLLLAQDPPPVDYFTQIQPVFNDSCAGGFCHIDNDTSGTDLTTYETTMASFGTQYEKLIVEPFRPDKSPLLEKIESDTPQFGQRMPRGQAFLSEEVIDLVRRWIEEGASSFPRVYLRGDVDGDDAINITDAIALLGYLFLGADGPDCLPAADADRNMRLELTDAIRILNFLFLGGESLEPLSPAEQAECNDTNRPPMVDPIGTFSGIEGELLQFQVQASDPDGDELIFSVDEGPEGLTVEPDLGLVSWTPDFGQAGDHPVAIRVTDARDPLLSAVGHGLLRISAGNAAPVIGATGPFVGREGELLEVSLAITDAEGDAVSITVTPQPDGLMIDEMDSGIVRWTPAIGQAGEHDLRFSATDDGVPPRSSEKTLRFVILEADTEGNNAPETRPQPIYRGYPGYEIAVPLGATDPDGDGLTYELVDGPEGCSLAADSGVFGWTPDEAQVGAYYVAYTVRDDGVPALEAMGQLTLQILPPNPCAIVSCDPANGCDDELVPLGEDCCSGDPVARIVEPDADCPDARVLHIGRNRVGFGRIQDCDRVEVIPLGQGGASIRVNVEARCVTTEAPILLNARLDVETVNVFDATRFVLMTDRGDGYAERRALAYASPPNIGPVFLDGQDAILTVTLEDDEGVIERSVRVRLTLDVLEDLP